MNNAAGTLLQRIRPKIILATILIWAALWLGLAAVTPQIHREHGPMENFQSVTLAVGIVLGASLLAPRYNTSARILGAGMALLFLGFLLLEFDTRHFDMPTLRRWTNGSLRNLWVGALFLAYGIALARHFKTAWSTFTNWLPSPPGLLMILSGAFWVTAHLVDKGMRFWGHGEDAGLLAEELIECEAALLMGLAAVLTRFVWSRTQLRP